MQGNNKKSIIENRILNRKIVYEINKAISDDVPHEIRENHLETNNRHIFAPGDYINENLRKHVVKDEVELLAFNRNGWEGRILIDKVNCVTYTISTHQTLRSIIRKNRNRPHYLQSILFAENGDCEGLPKQLSMGELYPNLVTSSFDTGELEEDYDKIMQGSVCRADGYRHYIVAYTSDHHTISAIEILLLDKDFAEVDNLDLMEYVNPDFASLTEQEYNELESLNENTEEVRKIPLKLKPGVKPVLRAMEEEV